MIDPNCFPSENDHALAGECEEGDRRFARWPGDTLTPIDGVDYHVCQMADLKDPIAKIAWLRDRVFDACIEILDTVVIAERAIGIAQKLVESASNTHATTEDQAAELRQTLESLDEYLDEQTRRMGDLLFQANLDNPGYRDDRARRNQQVEP